MDNFLDAFNTANTYKVSEATAAEKAAQLASKATTNIDQQKYQKCITILQKYANGQVPEWDQNDIDTLLKTLNDAGFSDKALQKINPILNSAKKQLNASQSQSNNAQQSQQLQNSAVQNSDTASQESTQNNSQQQTILQKDAGPVNSAPQQAEQKPKGNAANVNRYKKYLKTMLKDANPEDLIAAIEEIAASKKMNQNTSQPLKVG